MDRAERLIRDAKPPEQPLSARAEADLAKILASNSPDTAGQPPHAPHRQLHWAWAAAAVLVIAVVIAGVNLIRPDKAVAATPPMPTITSTGQDTTATLEELQSQAASQPDRSDHTEIVTQWWALASEVDATGMITSSSVDPRRRVATLGPAGITGYTDYAAQPFDTAGHPVDDPKAPAPGTRLDTVTIDPDERFVTEPPPTNPASFSDYLADLPLTSTSPTVNAFTGIRVILAEHILTPAQHAAFLGYLASLPDVDLLGTSTDRLGRSVLVFAAPTENNHQTLLMLSPDSGQITATEIIYRGSDRTDIPTPAVTQYVAWEAP